MSRLLEMGVPERVDPGIQINYDVAASWGPFVGSKTYEQVLLPSLRRMVRAYRDAGALFVVHHADENVLLLLDKKNTATSV